MAKAQSARGRLRQVEHWLRANFPCDKPVVVRVTNVYPHAAETARQGRKYIIKLGRIALARWGDEMIETLIHEWAHARVWRTHRENDLEHYHDAEWAIEYGALYQAFYDKGGDRDADEFPARPWR